MWYLSTEISKVTRWGRELKMFRNYYCGKLFSMLCVEGDVWRFTGRKQNQLFLLLSFLFPWSLFNVPVWKYKMPTIPVNKFFIASCACIFICTNSNEKLCLPAESDSYCCIENLILKNNIGGFISFFFLSHFFTLPSMWVIFSIISTNAK